MSSDDPSDKKPRKKSSGKHTAIRLGHNSDSGRPTVIPAVPTEKLAQAPGARRTPGGMTAVNTPREAQVTLTNERELEAARLASANVVTPPQPIPAPLVIEPDVPADPTTEIATYEQRLGPLDRVPYVVVAREDLQFLAIDHRAGFLLSHIDGVSSLETILDVSGLPRLHALRILDELVQKRVIALR